MASMLRAVVKSPLRQLSVGLGLAGREAVWLGFYNQAGCKRLDTMKRDFSDDSKDGKKTISVTFIDKNGEVTTVRAPIGTNMLEVAHQNDVELEGACEGSLACSTCHVIVEDPKFFEKLPEPSDDENDMLDLAFGLTEQSRLGCQIIATEDLDGIRLQLPAATRNFAVDGHVPKPH